jgi:hypothetical protein
MRLRKENDECIYHMLEWHRITINGIEWTGTQGSNRSYKDLKCDKEASDYFKHLKMKIFRLKHFLGCFCTGKYGW